MARFCWLAIPTVVSLLPKLATIRRLPGFAPEEGESGGGLAQKFPKSPLFAELRPIADGYLLLSPKGVMEDFAQDLSPEEQKPIIATQSPSQGAVLGTPIKKAAWRTKPSWCVIAENDRAISPDQERSTAERMKAKTLSLPTSHLPMLSQPQKVADFVIEAAASFG
jgi:pimeloyl-ACP methyl ester carboxylesterase